MDRNYISFNASNIITINLMVLIFGLFLGLLAMFYHQFFGGSSGGSN